MNKIGINPVTIRSDIVKGEIMSLARLYAAGTGRGTEMRKLITVMIGNEDAVEKAAAAKQELPVTTVTLGEDQLIAALGHLFPSGELADAHLQPLPAGSGVRVVEQTVIITAHLERAQHEQVAVYWGQPLDPYRDYTEKYVLSVDDRTDLGKLVDYLRRQRIAYQIETTIAYAPE